MEAYKRLVGGVAAPSRWFLLNQRRIDGFARVTEDEQYIHVDAAAAADSIYGGTIAHGFLMLAMLSAMFFDAAPGIEGAATNLNYGFNSIRFLKPVPSGRRVRGIFALNDLRERQPGQWQSTFDVSVEIEDGIGVALVGQWLILTMMRSER